MWGVQREGCMCRDEDQREDLPTSASITVSRGAAGKAIVVFISNI